MKIERRETLKLESSEDLMRVRSIVRSWMAEMKFSLVDQTKMVTATSELARNAIDYAGGGEAQVEALNNGRQSGIRLIFSDTGPGIADLDLAMRDGYTTAGGLGLGLGGARRLVNEFYIWSEPGQGTRVTVVKWR